MINLCFLGLSRSGKTCYLYAASHVLSKGIQTDYGVLSIHSTNEQQKIRLDSGLEDMADCHFWPKGSNQTMKFPFEFCIDGEHKTNFNIYDYRGGVLDDLRDDAQDERQELYETFKNACAIVFFIDAYTLIDAFDLKKDASEKFLIHQKGDVEVISSPKAINKIKHLELIVDKCQKKTNKNIPILLTITKKDILSKNELEEGIKKTKEILPKIFSPKYNFIVAVTAVSLGQNLGVGEMDEKQRKMMTGELMLDVGDNLHLPILFSLLVGLKLSEQEKKIARKILNNDTIEMYVAGKRCIYC